MVKFCTLTSGSSGNCIFVSDGKTRILVDAGVSGKKIEEGLRAIDEDAEQIDAVLVTHEHSDHISGIGVLSRRYDIPIYANCGTWNAMSGSIGSIKPHNIKEIESGNEFGIADIGIEAFSIPHDAADPVGYSFTIDGKKITVATDIGHINKPLFQQLSGSDGILLESNHDVAMLKNGAYPYPLKQRILGELGHLSNELAATLACFLVKKKTTKILLGHLSRENNTPRLAMTTVLNKMKEYDIQAGTDVELKVAERFTPSVLY